MNNGNAIVWTCTMPEQATTTISIDPVLDDFYWTCECINELPTLTGHCKQRFVAKLVLPPNATHADPFPITYPGKMQGGYYWIEFVLHPGASIAIRYLDPEEIWL